MPPKVRGPSLANEILEGAAFDLAIKSCTEAMGESARTSTPKGLLAIKATGTKSLAGS